MYRHVIYLNPFQWILKRKLCDVQIVQERIFYLRKTPQVRSTALSLKSTEENGFVCQLQIYIWTVQVVKTCQVLGFPHEWAEKKFVCLVHLCKDTPYCNVAYAYSFLQALLYFEELSCRGWSDTLPIIVLSHAN